MKMHDELMPTSEGCRDDCEGSHLLTATAEQIARACVEAHKEAK